MVSVLRSLGEGLSERKWSETVVGLEEGVGLSTDRQCSLKRSLSRLFVSPMYCLLQRLSIFEQKLLLGLKGL